jgi:5'-deoxynucleotidase YfbR-like HD superfamily hydrolase
VSLILPDDLKLRGLLHDASEAYLVDVPRPLKKIADFAAYRRIERETQSVIYNKYGLSAHDIPEVHDADNLALATEARDLMGNPAWAHGMPMIKATITPWSPEHAEKMFLKKFEELSK